MSPIVGTRLSCLIIIHVVAANRLFGEIFKKKKKEKRKKEAEL